MEHDSGIFKYLHTFDDDDHSTVWSSDDKLVFPLNADFPAYNESFELLFEHPPGPFEESSLYGPCPFGIYPGVIRDNSDNDNFLLPPSSPGFSVSTSSASSSFALASPPESIASYSASSSGLTDSAIASYSPSSRLDSPPASLFAMAGCCSPADIFSQEFNLKNGSDVSLYFGKDDSGSDIEHDTELELGAPRDLCSPSRPECDRSCDKIPSKSSPPLFMNPSGSMDHDQPLFKGSMKNRDLKRKERVVPSNASSKSSKSKTHNFNFSRSSSITKPSTSSSATKIKQGGEETEISHHLVTSHHRAAKRAVIYHYRGDDTSEYEDSDDDDDDEYDDNNKFRTSSRKRKRKKSSYCRKRPPLSYPRVAAMQVTNKKAKTDCDVDLDGGPSYQRSPLEPIASGSDSQRLKKGKGKPVQIANASAEEPEKEKYSQFHHAEHGMRVLSCAEVPFQFLLLPLSPGNMFKDDSRTDIEHDTELELGAPRDLCSPSRPECDRSCNKIPLKSSPPLFMNPSGSMYRGDKPLFKGSKKNRDLKQKDRGVPLNASSKPSKSGTHNFIFSRSSSITKPISTSSSVTKIKQGGEETEISHHLVTSHHRAAKRAVIYRYQYGQVDDDDGDNASEYEDSVDDDEYDDNNNFCTPSRKRKRKKSSYRPKQPPLSYPQVAAKQTTKKKAKTDRDVDLVCGPSYQRSPLEPIASGSDSQRSKRGKDSQRLKKGKGKPVQIANPSAEEPEKEKSEKEPSEDWGGTFTCGWDFSRGHWKTSMPTVHLVA
ncbi:hypothetical protein FB446DRAFT_700519 [Lentinula raphanica]|nr:hypothetical protein FB446DRAFT_700519 [Lentinula raphanica]